jgi:quinol monooxygenase YgiN
MIGFYTKFTTEEHTRDALVGILSEAASAMQSLSDCQMYIVNKDSLNPKVIWVTEIWITSEAHRASLQMEGAKELIAKALPLLIEKPEQIQLLPISGKGL